MFIEIAIENTLIIEPEYLGEKLSTHISEQLNQKFIKKIVKGKGIVLHIKDFRILESKVVPGSGELQTKVK